MATSTGWDPVVTAFIEYRNNKMKKAKIKRAEALETIKAIRENIKGLSDGEKGKKKELSVDYYDTHDQIAQLKLTIGECQTDIRKAIDNAHQPELFPAKPFGKLEVDDDEDPKKEADADQPELIEGSRPMGRTKRADIDGPWLANG